MEAYQRYSPYTKDQILREKQLIIDRYGPWTADNIPLGHGLYTRLDTPTHNPRAERFITIANALLKKPISEIRVLDLACLEGQYAIEFALRGCEVVGIEGREQSVAKANFSKEVLNLDRLTFYQDDVRNLTKDKYGEFDLIICSGILYHLDFPDVYTFLERIFDCSIGTAIIDTHISITRSVEKRYGDRSYFGCMYEEHKPQLSKSEKLSNPWASLDNELSFWPTHVSLVNMLHDVGFGLVCVCDIPTVISEHGRITLIAHKIEKSDVKISAGLSSTDERYHECLDTPPPPPTTLLKKCKRKIKSWLGGISKG